MDYEAFNLQPRIMQTHKGFGVGVEATDIGRTQPIFLGLLSINREEDSLAMPLSSDDCLDLAEQLFKLGRELAKEKM